MVGAPKSRRDLSLDHQPRMKGATIDVDLV
jgi:hypothetical protein